MAFDDRAAALANAVGDDVKLLRTDVEGMSKKVDQLISPNYAPRTSMTGPANPDAATIVTGAAADGTYDRAYTIAAETLPANWPVAAFGKMTTTGNLYLARLSNGTQASVTTFRMMTDAPSIVLYMTTSGFTVDLFVDGQPHASNPITLGATAGFGTNGFQKLTWGAAKPEGRLIEIRTLAGIIGVYAKKPYRLWKPPADINPSIAVVGDSWVHPLTMSDTAAGSASGDTYLPGIYQGMHAPLGLTRLTTDGIGGSGYIEGGAPETPYSHPDRITWLNTVAADVEIIHGGCANDLFGGNSVSDSINAAVAYFAGRRSDRPNAKLVFVEGFAPPGYPPATYNPNYIAVREGVQAQLNASGIGVYYLDVATTAPPLIGSGYVTAPNGNENSNIYVGSDSYHLTKLGHRYIRGFLAPKIARVLADDGTLVGQLI